MSKFKGKLRIANYTMNYDELSYLDDSSELPQWLVHLLHPWTFQEQSPRCASPHRDDCGLPPEPCWPLSYEPGAGWNEGKTYRKCWVLFWIGRFPVDFHPPRFAWTSFGTRGRFRTIGILLSRWASTSCYQFRSPLSHHQSFWMAHLTVPRISASFVRTSASFE